jgi:hypothetical protein
MAGWGSKVKKLYPETLTQKAIVHWFRLQYPGIRDHLIKIGNGGKKTPQGHILSAAMGEVVGASDLFLAIPCGGYAGLWIEVKPEKFKLVPSNKAHVERQMNFLYNMEEVGYAGELVIGSKAGIEVIKGYMELET